MCVREYLLACVCKCACSECVWRIYMIENVYSIMLVYPYMQNVHLDMNSLQPPPLLLTSAPLILLCSPFLPPLSLLPLFLSSLPSRRSAVPTCVLMDDTCTVHVHICLIDFTAYQDNTTPLYVACDKGHQEIVQILLAAGADVKIARSTVRA